MTSFSFQQEIKDQLRQEQEEYTQVTDYWRASDTGKCLRSRFYKRLNIPYTKDYDDRTLRVFRVGDIFHQWLQELAEKRGVSVAKEGTVFSEDGSVQGHFDQLIKPNGSDDLFLYDYKSKHSYGFKYLNTDGAQKDHKGQITLYKMLIEQNGYAVWDEDLEGTVWYPPVKIAGTRILYISKDDLRVMEFDGQADEEEIRKEYKLLNRYWKNQELPPCTCHEMYNGSGPKYCTYNHGDSCCSETLWRDHKESNEQTPVSRLPKDGRGERTGGTELSPNPSM